MLTILHITSGNCPQDITMTEHTSIRLAHALTDPYPHNTFRLIAHEAGEDILKEL